MQDRDTAPTRGVRSTKHRHQTSPLYHCGGNVNRYIQYPRKVGKSTWLDLNQNFLPNILKSFEFEFQLKYLILSYYQFPLTSFSVFWNLIIRYIHITYYTTDQEYNDIITTINFWLKTKHLLLLVNEDDWHRDALHEISKSISTLK